jgi:hypothetical protein
VETADWCAAVAPYEVKEAFAASLREIRQVWREQLERSRRPREPKDPPPQSVDQ